MNPQLCKLAHMGLSTPDLDASLTFFRDLVGMEEVARDGSRVYLRCFTELDHHSLTLREGPTGVDHVAFRTSRPEDVGAYAARLEADGVAVERVPDGEELGQGEAIRFAVPHLDAPFELLYEIDRPLSPPELRSKLPTNSTRMRAASPRRIDHVNLATSLDTLGPAEAWVREQLGFQRREYVQRGDGTLAGSWLSVTPQVHDLAITLDHKARTGRLNHLAFNMESVAEILRLADVLREHDIHVDIAPGRHGVTQGFFYYVRDPGSGHRVEFFSGGYLIFDPDWEPIAWSEEQLARYGYAWIGPGWSREGNPNAPNTPCLAQAQTPVGAS